MLQEEFKVTNENCINVTATPATEDAVETINIDLDLKEDDFLNQFSSEPLLQDPMRAKSKIKNLISFLTSKGFANKVNSVAYKTGIPPQQIAKGFISRAFGTVSDILGITIDVIHATLSSLINLLYIVLQKGIDIITAVLRGMSKIITFNQTAVES